MIVNKIFKSPFESVNPINGFFFLALSILFGSVVFGTDQIDAELTQTLLKMDEYSWDALGDETIPLEQQWDSVLDMLNTFIRIVPQSFLKNGVSPLPPNISALADDPAQFRGQAFELKGNVVLVKEIPLNPAEKKILRIPSVFRCRMTVGEKTVDVLTAFVPAAWKRNEAMNERAAVTGIFIKRLAASSANSGFIPLLVAPRIRWFPDTFLGNLGFDVGSFDQVPALRISDLKKKQFDGVPPSLQLLGRNEIIQRAFKFTEADREPFYGLLQAASQTPPNQIAHEAKKLAGQQEKKMTIIDLFNNPEGTRGKPVLLRGVAKRVLPTLVEDKEVKALYGIEKYYQIYFYTDDSQGNPMVACVTSLPERMPIGAAPDYAEKISIAAIPYKLWVYETSAKLEGGSGYKPNYAPLLIGQSPIWHPKEKAMNLPPVSEDTQNTRTTISFTIFFILLAVWIIFRRFQNKRAIEFKMSNRNRSAENAEKRRLFRIKTKSSTFSKKC